MVNQSELARRGKAVAVHKHRAQFSLGVILVPALKPCRRSNQSCLLERQLELLQELVRQQADLALPMRGAGGGQGGLASFLRTVNEGPIPFVSCLVGIQKRSDW